MADDFYDDPDAPASTRPWLKPAALALAMALLLGGAVWALVAFLGHPVDKSHGVQSIALINQPPPPPPKPPEKPPEPPKIKEEVKVDTPKDPPKADDPKPTDKPSSDKPLGLDANGAAGTDGFGLAANKGGQDIAGSGSGGGNGAYYSGLLQRQFFEALSRNRKVLHDEFRVVVKIWLADDGRVTRADIVSGSGNTQVDEQIQVTLMDMQPLRDVPPSSMRPMQLRLSNRS
ncbi:MAG: energy transducer TonB [Betaproteobacteria bacterium]